MFMFIAQKIIWLIMKVDPVINTNHTAAHTAVKHPEAHKSKGIYITNSSTHSITQQPTPRG